MSDDDDVYMEEDDDIDDDDYHNHHDAVPVIEIADGDEEADDGPEYPADSDDDDYEDDAAAENPDDFIPPGQKSASPREPAARKHSSASASSSGHGHDNHLSAEDLFLASLPDHRNSSSTAARLKSKLPDVYNRDRWDFDDVEKFNAYKEQIIRYTYALTGSNPQALAEIQSKVAEDEQFDEQHIQERNRKRKRMTPDDLATAKRKYIMEEYKRVELRRGCRISLMNEVALAKTTTLSLFAQEAVRVQKKIEDANAATLNPTMGTGLKRDLQMPAVYRPTVNVPEQQQIAAIPRVLTQPGATRAPMSDAASVAAGWNMASLLDLFLHEALGGLKTSQVLGSGSGNPVMKLPGGNVVRV